MCLLSRDISALFNPKTSILFQERHLYTVELFRDSKSELLQVNGEYYGHGSMGMNLDPSQHHHLHNHHASMAAMQMPLNPGDGMI